MKATRVANFARRIIVVRNGRFALAILQSWSTLMTYASPAICAIPLFSAILPSNPHDPPTRLFVANHRRFNCLPAYHGDH
jgi:hypothetical protein